EWSAARWAALPTGVTIDSVQGTVAVFDAAGAEQALTAAQINSYHAAGMNTIQDSENASILQFNVSQTSAILSDSILVASFPTPATLIGYVVDTGTNLSTLTTTQIGQLHAAGFTAIDATNDAVQLTKAQVDAL